MYSGGAHHDAVHASQSHSQCVGSIPKHSHIHACRHKRNKKSFLTDCTHKSPSITLWPVKSSPQQKSGDAQTVSPGSLAMLIFSVVLCSLISMLCGVGIRYDASFRIVVVHLILKGKIVGALIRQHCYYTPNPLKFTRTRDFQVDFHFVWLLFWGFN